MNCSSIAQKQRAGKTAKQDKQKADTKPSITLQATAADESNTLEAEQAAAEAKEASEGCNAERAQPGNEPEEAAGQPDSKLRQKPGNVPRAASTIERGKPKGYVSAISANGFTTRGRVRQKSHKSAHLVSVGQIR